MKLFWSSFFGRAVLVMAVLDAAATLALLGFGRAHWLLGVWGSALWFFCNAFLLWRMAAQAVSGKFPSTGTFVRWSVIKFPVLYAAGVGFLLVPGVSLYGVLVTFTAFLAGMGAALYKGNYRI